jgi:hypothetical protein
MQKGRRELPIEDAIQKAEFEQEEDKKHPKEIALLEMNFR